ncbi:MAG: VCBS repeat-containing protein [Phycisphaeraceae bacterium]|nr:VCBS repeat-containing protein [Phycisphaeraceae bacterium]
MKTRAMVGMATGAMLLGVAGTASATWSIIIIDTRTGEIGVASATCLTGFDLRVNTPVLIPGVGAATAQSFVDGSGQNRVKVRDMLVQGAHPDDILAALSVFDSGHQTRQYGIADTRGRAATFSGTGAGAWAGGQIGVITQGGELGDLVYAVQGNVLTGEPVVTNAVQAIIDTPGDIAAKLMASMEAARSMGGDGRCSCPGSGGPTGCGAPPPSFAKSAHIAYMLISRDGDTPGCNSVIRAGNRPFDLAIGDVDGDGRADVVTCSDGTTIVLLNAREPGDAFVTLREQVAYPSGADTRGVAIADITGDGVPDIVAAAYGADSLVVQPGNGDGTFGAPMVFAAGDGPRLVATGDFNGDGLIDVACTNQLSNDVSIYLNIGGTLGAQTRRTVGSAPSSIFAGDFDGDGDVDLAVLVNGARRVSILRNDGAGAFAISGAITIGENPTDMCTADLDGDGDLDLATADRGSNMLSILTNNGAGAFTRTTIDSPSAPTRLRALDVTGDGVVDIVVTAATDRRARVYEGNGAGGFALRTSFSVNDGLLDLELEDMNDDGTPDVVAVGGGVQSIIVVESNGPAAWNDGSGCATGDYFMNFNVANTVASDPEPVFTLQTMYDAWRAALVGRPDAVASRVWFDAPALPTDGRVVMMIELLDWRGEPITIEPGALLVEHASGSDELSEIGVPEAIGGGVYRVALHGPDAGTGHDRFLVVALDEIRPVTLMPAASIGIVVSPADFDGSGEIDILDFLTFFDAFGSGDMSADLTGDGALDENDVALFMAGFAR